MFVRLAPKRLEGVPKVFALDFGVAKPCGPGVDKLLLCRGAEGEGVVVEAFSSKIGVCGANIATGGKGAESWNEKRMYRTMENGTKSVQTRNIFATTQ